MYGGVLQFVNLKATVATSGLIEHTTACIKSLLMKGGGEGVTGTAASTLGEHCVRTAPRVSEQLRDV